MKYCRNCGSEVDEDDIYCGYCGSKLKEDNHREGASSQQDFKEEEPLVGADFSSDFDKDFESSFDDDLDKDFGNSREFGKTDGPVEEFESYVENDYSNQPTFDSSGRTEGSEHKPLLPNKLAKEANTYGILALVFGFLGGILGIVFGIIGIQKAKKAMELCETGEYDGRPKARDARTLSIVGIILAAFELIFWIF